jgi:hypothetical protein
MDRIFSCKALFGAHPGAAGFHESPPATRRELLSRANWRKTVHAPVRLPLIRERVLVLQNSTVERAVADIRHARRAADLATVRVESPPGDPLQIKNKRVSGSAESLSSHIVFLGTLHSF